MQRFDARTQLTSFVCLEIHVSASPGQNTPLYRVFCHRGVLEKKEKVLPSLLLCLDLLFGHILILLLLLLLLLLLFFLLLYHNLLFLILLTFFLLLLLEWRGWGV